MTKQENTREFQPGDRVIFNGQYVGWLINRVEAVNGPWWTIRWEDGAHTGGTPYNESMLVHANGGPSSAMEEELTIITAAATSWLYELEEEIIPGSGSKEDRDGYEEQARKLRAALTKIGADV